MDSLKFLFQLEDQISAPAKRMDAAIGALEGTLDRLEAPLKGVDQTLKQLGSSMDATAARSHALMEAQLRMARQMDISMRNEADRAHALAVGQMRMLGQMEINARKAHGELVQVIQDLGKVRNEVEKKPKEKGGFLDFFSGGGVFGTALFADLMPVVSVIDSIGGKIRDVVGGLADMTLGAARFAVGQAEFKRQTLSQLELMTGNRKEAEQYYDWFNKIAKLTPLGMQDVVPMGLRLKNAGFSNRAIEAVMATVSDASGGEAAQAQGILEQLLQMRTVGHVTQADLRPILQRSNMVEDNVFDMVAKRKGVARSSIDRNHLSFDDFLAGYMDAVNEKFDGGKGLGTRTKQAGVESLGGQLSTLEDNFKDLFRDVNFDPILAFLRNLNDLLDTNTDTGKRAHDILNKLFNDVLGNFFARYSGESGAKRLEHDLNRILDIAEKLAMALERIASIGIFAGNSALTAAFGETKNTTAGERLGAGAISAAVDMAEMPFLPYIFAAQTYLGLGDIAKLPTPAPGLPKGDAEALAGIIGAPRYASGGIVTGPTLALIGEAGPEAVVPLSGGGGASALAGFGGAHAEVTIVVQAGSDSSPAMVEAVSREVRTVLPSALQSAFEQLAMQAGAA